MIDGTNLKYNVFDTHFHEGNKILISIIITSEAYPPLKWLKMVSKCGQKSPKGANIIITHTRQK